MVMAQYSNIQYVAHEFVRQYYTMLHKDPSQLHRFYMKESRLTHGGAPNMKIEEPVVGQEAIHEKISQLNFRNCYAKIRSVDSHPTIAGGVVIQVTGELSNSGMAMRKFMQTFVLAQQDLKKYYVYNDIFRYQDEYYDDTENEETVDESETGFQGNEIATVDAETEKNDYASEMTSHDGGYGYHQTYSTQAEVKTEVAFEESSSSEEEKFEEEVDLTDNQQVQTSTLEVEYDAMNLEEIEQPQDAFDNNNEGEQIVETKHEIDSKENHQDDDVTEVEGPPKQVTWAALAKKNTVQAAAPVVTVKPQVKKNGVSQPRQKKQEESTPPKKEGGDEPRRRLPVAPDTHQVFIGNLPSGVTEQEIRDVFQEYGTIVEVRLNPKNFGFVAFDSSDAPNKILQKTKSIVINTNMINIEEKRSGGSNRSAGGGPAAGGGIRKGGDSYRGSKNDRGGFRNSGPNRSGGGKSSFGQKRNMDDMKLDKNKDPRASREQKPRR